jgi:hypothetical protein
MPKAYMVFSYQSPPGPHKLAAYGKLAIPAFEPFGARLLARGNAVPAYDRVLKERILFPRRENRLAIGQGDAHAFPDRVRVFRHERENIGREGFDALVHRAFHARHRATSQMCSYRK